ncbi:MAG: pyridoxal phosphate-dependent aminotransferase [Lachnospiraceae bacterium]
MIAKKMTGFVENNSAIREMFEEGKRLAKEFGAENVYDFSLGNPNVPAPKAVNDAIKDIIDNEETTFVHGYMSNAGYEDVREDIAASLNRRFEENYSKDNIIMTVGAAGGLNVVFRAILDPGDEVVAFAPYFLEYRAYVSNYDGVLVEVSPNKPEFMPNLKEFEEKLTPRTKCVLINNPNNPTGVVYPESVIKDMISVIEKKSREYGTDIYLISDEPYRELAYEGVKVPYLPHYYANTIVGYSFSKSLSLPGERIGYLTIPGSMKDFETVVSALTIANRILGYVNAPSLMQRAVARAIDSKTDVGYYDRNRRLLRDTLRDIGFEFTEPYGAFYLFVKSPMEDEKQFCSLAKEENIIIVPGSSFACPGYVRLAYCVSYETIESSIPAWKRLMDKIKEGA